MSAIPASIEVGMSGATFSRLSLFAEDARLAGALLREHRRREDRRDDRHVTRDQVLHRRGASLVRDMLHLQAPALQLEELARQVGDRPGPRGAVRVFAGIRLDQAYQQILV